MKILKRKAEEESQPSGGFQAGASHKFYTSEVIF
jgi:hypothetical protein